MEVKVNDKYIFHSKNGMDYRIEVISVNEFRDPSMKYGCDVWDGNGAYAGDVTFVGDDFFNEHRTQLETVEDWVETKEQTVKRSFDW